MREKASLGRTCTCMNTCTAKASPMRMLGFMISNVSVCGYYIYECILGFNTRFLELYMYIQMLMHAHGVALESIV